MPCGSAVAGLAAGAFTEEATFSNEALEERGDAVGREGPFECVAYIFVGDDVVVGKEGGETLVDVGFLGVESLTVRLLLYLELQGF